MSNEEDIQHHDQIDPDRQNYLVPIESGNAGDIVNSLASSEITQNKMIKFEENIENAVIELDDKDDDKLIVASSGAMLPIEEGGSEMDSGFQSRPDSVQEIMKKKIYKQAVNINQNALNTPQSKRIHESVTKVFGSDDPPPGFGLIYPKYYYLEQKRPQPMPPLKVWRGFNGNIYFEPIQCHPCQANENINSIEINNFDLQDKLPASQHTSRTFSSVNRPITSNSPQKSKLNSDSKLRRSKTDVEIKNRKSNKNKPSSRERIESIKQIEYTPISTNINNNNNNQHVPPPNEFVNEEEYVFLTEQHANLELHRTLNSSASITQPPSLAPPSLVQTLYQENFHPNADFKRSWTKVTMETSTSTQIKNNKLRVKTAFPLTNVDHNTEPKSASKLPPAFTKLPNPNKKLILPNPTTRPSKGPIRGLAYKEAKQRIIDSTGSGFMSYYGGDFEDNYVEQLNKQLSQLSQNDSNMSQNSESLTRKSNESTNKKRFDYKQMMKKIRKGLTNPLSSTRTSTHDLNHLTPSLVSPNKNERKNTPSGYVAANTTLDNSRNMASKASVSHDSSVSTDDLNSNSEVTTNYIDFLKVKGDKIYIDAGLIRTANNSSYNRSKRVLIDDRLINFDPRSAELSRRKSASNQSFGFKSYSSTYSVLGLPSRRRHNPTPDIEFQHSYTTVTRTTTDVLN